MIQNFSERSMPLKQIETALSSIGYRTDLLIRNCEYADTTGTEYVVRQVSLAGFAQTPPSYRNACIGVVSSNGICGAELIAQHRALGAPLFFEITDETINRWKVTEKGLPKWIESIPIESISNAFQAHRAEWEPDRIFRAKVIGDTEEVRQLDFFDIGLMPLLEGMIYGKLDQLLRETLREILGTYKEYNRGEPKYEDIYRLVFRFIVAKVMRDRHYPGDWNSDNADVILSAVEKYYGVDSSTILQQAKHREEILDQAWRAIANTFHFQNLSVDDLAFVYESTLVTSETRKTFGTHSTPPRIAEYIVNKLPFQELPEAERYVLEPCAGHGGFLIAAMRRLRELLPDDISGKDRHKYLVQRLVGIEIDPFAVEVCWSRLVLADYPHANGWQTHVDDVFKGDILKKALKKAQVVLCNPPFEKFTSDERAYYNDPEMLVQKPAELLRRVLNEPPELLGLVIPRVFETGTSYRQFHHQLAENYGNIELVALPGVFNYSEAVTTLVMASDRRQGATPVAVTCRKVAEGTERDTFLFHGTEPPAVKDIVDVEDYLRPNFSLWIPPLSRIWSYLNNNERLGDHAEMHRGLQWIPMSNQRGRKTERFFSETPKFGYVKGYARAQGHLLQYSIGDAQYVSLRPQDQVYKAHEYNWNSHKVICNAARLSRGPWRIGAVTDQSGAVFSNRFIAFWTPEEISDFALAALLNSPLCNAFLFSKETSSLNRISSFEALPLPSLDTLRVDGKVDTLSKDLHRHISNNEFDIAKHVLLQIDAEILRAYDLPPALERELLDTFQGIQRPVPFEFTGYYPEGFTAYFPLHEVISEEFADARADRLLERLIVINDPVLTEAMALLRGESVDEGLSS